MLLAGASLDDGASVIDARSYWPAPVLDNLTTPVRNTAPRQPDPEPQTVAVHDEAEPVCTMISLVCRVVRRRSRYSCRALLGCVTNTTGPAFTLRLQATYRLQLLSPRRDD